MKNDQLIGDKVPKAEVSQAINIAINCTNNFEELVRALSLDRTCDFQNSDLSGVDFSNSDLRGFNFTGSNLSDCIGEDVQFDETTIFANTETVNSIFSKYVREQILFKNKPEIDRLYGTLRNGAHSEISSWANNRFSKGSDSHRLLKEIDDTTISIMCQKLLTEKIDVSKRITLFYHLKYFTRSSSEMREIILDVFARNSDDAALISAFLDVAARLFSKDPIIEETLYDFCNSTNEETRQAAFRALAKSNFPKTNFDRLKKLVFKQKNLNLRRLWIRSAALKLGMEHLKSISGTNKTRDLDLADVWDYNGLITAPEPKSSNTQNLYPADLPHINKIRDEVLSICPLLSIIFAKELPIRSKNALIRLQRKTLKQERIFESKVRSASRMRI